jgi:hypothetical protein
MMEWSEAHFKDSLINSSVGENYVIDLLKYDKKPSVMVLNHADVHNALPAHHERGRGRRRRVPREQVRDPATPVPLQGGHVPQRCRASVLKRLQPPSSTKHWRCAAAGSTRDSSAETAALFAEPSAGAFASRRCLHTLAAHRQFEGRGGHRSGRAEARRRGTDARAVRSTDARAAAALPRQPPLRLWWRGDSRPRLDIIPTSRLAPSHHDRRSTSPPRPHYLLLCTNITVAMLCGPHNILILSQAQSLCRKQQFTGAIRTGLLRFGAAGLIGGARESREPISCSP